MKLLKTLLAGALWAGAGMALAQDVTVEVTITELSEGAKIDKLAVDAQRCDKYKFSAVPAELENTQTVYTPRGAGSKPGAAFSFSIDRDATVYLLVHKRGKATIPDGWEKTDLKASWKAGSGTFHDACYKRDFPVGTVEIPAHDGRSGSSYGIPNLAIIKSK